MQRSARSLAPALVLCMPLACEAANGFSASLHLCDAATPMTATQQDRLLRFAGIVKRELDDSGETLALISRNGTDLRRFDVRYSHAGLSLKASDNGPWSVRQLYYACDERRPRLFDQGLSGFLFGTDSPDLGYLSIVLLPGEQANALERTALDNPRVLRLLAARYSANAYAFSDEYQNCNQWVAELLATAWAPLADTDDLRSNAQRWLASAGYAPGPVEVRSRVLMAIAPFVPMIHVDDHPMDDQFALHFRTSLPVSLEHFVRAQVPGAYRTELCHDTHRIIIHHGWDDLPDNCQPLEGDRVIPFD